MTPSRWVQRHAALIAPAARVLDYACGAGRHARWLAGQGMTVVAVDRDEAALRLFAGVAGVETRVADLEGNDWPLDGDVFQAIVVTRYLYRPRFHDLLNCLQADGVLIYETFMQGNERYGKPSHPDFLLRPGELLTLLPENFSVVAFEQGREDTPFPSLVQRICAINSQEPVKIPG